MGTIFWRSHVVTKQHGTVVPGDYSGFITAEYNERAQQIAWRRIMFKNGKFWLGPKKIRQYKQPADSAYFLGFDTLHATPVPRTIEVLLWEGIRAERTEQRIHQYNRLQRLHIEACDPKYEQSFDLWGPKLYLKNSMTNWLQKDFWEAVG